MGGIYTGHIPTPYTGTPGAEVTAGAPGSGMEEYAMGDHSHPRPTSATIVTLDASGLATATFTRQFDAEPCVDLTPIAPGGTQPVALQVDSWIIVAGKYVGCVVKGYRAAPTTLAAVTVLSVSVAVGSQIVTPFVAAPSVRVSVIALQSSAV